jgi:hypothetical protein
MIARMRPGGGGGPKQHEDTLTNSGPPLPTMLPYQFHIGIAAHSGTERIAAQRVNIPDVRLYDLMGYQPGVLRTRLAAITGMRRTLFGHGSVPIVSSREV